MTLNLNHENYKKYKYLIWGVFITISPFLFKAVGDFSGFLKLFLDWKTILMLIYFFSPYIILFLIKYFVKSNHILSITNTLSIISCVLAIGYIGFALTASSYGPLGGFLLFLIPAFQIATIVLGFVLRFLVPSAFKFVYKFFQGFL